MATYKPANIGDALRGAGDGGNGSRYSGSSVITANLAISDKVRPCRVPAGTLVDRVVVKVPDLDSGTTLQAKIGFAPIDGSAQVSGDDTAVAAAGAWAQAAATTTYEIFPPFLVLKDSFLEIAVTAAGIGTGTVYGKVEGEAIGVR